MPMTDHYLSDAPPRTEIDALQGPTLLEFGTGWCGHCQRAQPALAMAFARYPDVRHIKVEDGSGRPLGRSFRVRLWPTLVFLRDGQEVSRLVRPVDAGPILEAMAAIA
ncbi:hypothetical protein LMG31506_01342 [Cupriavidus yeoncheonensis]|uniref:Thioredoxin domain-containing protein n=1 Tax=Cupriavidus yeoncheonensis TaxID=1462994 RepID=A0A916IUF7_9BURK|nr:thioredoxin family protein [Cupriavidus yeoncheonensis]CAG2134224.1 hypothetical protein LMG31506_01342 [Cupriavidus yeoncheonensis]